MTSRNRGSKHLQYFDQATDVELMPPFSETEYLALGSDVQNLTVHFGILHPDSMAVVPRHEAGNLRTLKIVDIDDDLNWDHFEGVPPTAPAAPAILDIPAVPAVHSRVIFSSITSLDLGFSAARNDQIAYELGENDVEFPCLQNLSVQGSTGIYSDFYDHFSLPQLSTLKIADDYQRLSSVSLDAMHHAKKVIITAAILPDDAPAIPVAPVKEQIVPLLTAESEGKEPCMVGVRYAMPDDIRLASSLWMTWSQYCGLCLS